MEEMPKIRVWYYHGSDRLNFPAWELSEIEMKAIHLAGRVAVHEVEYVVEKLVYDTHGEALLVYLASE